VNNHIEPKFLILGNIDIYFGIRGLFQARMNKWFDFEIQ